MRPRVLAALLIVIAVLRLERMYGASELQTMTLRFEEYRGRDNDEAPLAQLVAQQYGVRHTIQELSRDEFLACVPRAFEVMDQPSVDGLNSYFISKAAHEMGLKVAMSGAGGDELFGGYTSFRDIPRWMPVTSLLSRIPRFGDAVHSVNAAMARRSRHVSPKMGEIVPYGASYAGAYFVKRGRFLTSELDYILGREIAHEGLRRLDMLNVIELAVTPDPGNAFARLAAIESSLYLRNQILRDMDWASMTHSLEVRVPLVHAHLLRRVAPALVGRRERGKTILAEAPRSPLREAVRNRRKTGFTLPIREWLREEGCVEQGKRNWARRVYAEIFSAERGN